ncbi:glutaredoxin [Candidatus Parcubacteria bacterium]|nr:MAG: glutaredoxin [Candidatus Parcubacteria bacterium]
MIKKVMKKIFLAALLILSFLPSAVFAQNKVQVWEFGLATCVHCKQVKEYMAEKIKQNQNIDFQYFEMLGAENQENRNKFQVLADIYGLSDNNSVPVIFIGDKFIIGEDYSAIDIAIDYCQNKICQSPEEKLASAGENWKNKNLPEGKKEQTVGLIFLTLLLIIVAVFIMKIIKKK